MKLVIEVELGNDAMQSANEAATTIHGALLRQASSMTSPLGEQESGSIQDENGNTVGHWKVVE